MNTPLTLLTLSAVLIPGLAYGQFDTLELRNETDSRIQLRADLQYLNLEKDVTWADFDLDGDMDVAVAIKFVGSIEGGFPNLLLMNENGVLVDRTVELASDSDLAGDNGFLADTNDRNVEAIDVNNDGFKDLVTATTMSDGLDWTIGQPRVYMNLGNDGSGNWLGFRHEHLRIPQMYSISGNVANPRFCDIAWGDFNGDGYMDIFYSDYDTPETQGQYCVDINGDGDTNDPGECQDSPAENSADDFNAKLLYNWGDSQDGPGAGYFYDTEYSVMTSSELSTDFGNAAEAGDFNNDGKLDFAHCNTLGANIIEIFYNEGAQPGTDFGVEIVYSGAPYHLKVDDLDGDADLDIVVIDDSQDRYLINEGNGGDGRAEFTSYVISDSLSEFGNTPSCFDIDMDGDLDLFVPDVDADLPSFCPSTGRRAHFYENTGVKNNLFVENHFPIPTNMLDATFDVAPIDINGDGFLDIVQASCEGFTIWMNVPQIRVDFDYPSGLPETVEPGTPTTVEVSLSEVGGSIDSGTAMLMYSIDSGSYAGQPLSSQGGGVWSASLPQIDCGQDLKYYFMASINGIEFNDPPSAPGSYYTVVPSTGNELTTISFETDDGGFVASASAGTTAGFWERADPNGTFISGQISAPDDAASGPGTLCWVTENGLPGATAGTNDLDAGTVTLTSGAIDLSGGDAVISAMVWMSCDDAVGSPADADSMVIEVTNDGTNWVEVMEVTADTNEDGGISAADADWYPRSFLVSDHVEPTADVQVRFAVSDNPNNSVTEAGIDEFNIDRVLCEDGPVCGGDFDDNGVVNGNDLAVVLAGWGTSNPAGDTNNDGVINGVDLATVLASWGVCP